jgi:hypothetical protein
MLSMAKTYAPVGRCIYCGTTERPLGKEHIIQESLGGRLILPKASCESCGAATSAAEGHVANMYGGWRFLANIPRKGKKQHPEAMSTRILDALGRISAELSFRREQYPAAVALPLLQAPAILTGVRHEQCDARLIIWNQDFVKGPPGDFWQLPAVNMPMFCRTLGKIAHAYCTAERGAGAFKSWLPPMILGTHDRPADFVGVMRDGLPAESYIHRISCMRLLDQSGQQLICAQVRLFATLEESPEYLVVVGQSLESDHQWAAHNEPTLHEHHSVAVLRW